MKYPHLFEPLKVNQMIIKNRIISAPLGSLTDKSISGIGMIIRGTSGCVPDGRSRMAPGPYCFEDMIQSTKVREQVSIIRQRGAKAEFELCHVGQYAKVAPGDYAIGPVGFIREDGTEVEMTESIDYGDTELRAMLEGDRHYNDRESYSNYGYQEQEFKNNELVNVESDSKETNDDYTDDLYDAYTDDSENE